MNDFAEWLSGTRPSVFIQSHEAWMIPLLQSVHIIGIGLVVGSVMMLALRVLGLIGMDQSLRQNQRRFGPWLTGALSVMLATGGLLVIAEPVRELVTFSFWVKMALVATLTVLAIVFQRSVSRRGPLWEESLVTRPSIRLAAVLTFLMLACIILLGRLIAYDHIWGHLSPATKA
jgi:hypothetical protein